MERILQISTALLCLLVAVLADPPADVNQLNREINQAAASAIRNAQAALNNSLNSAQPGSSVAVSCSSDAHGNNNCQKKTVDASGHTNIVNTSNSGGAVVSSGNHNVVPHAGTPGVIHTTLTAGAAAASIHSVVSILSLYHISCLL